MHEDPTYVPWDLVKEINRWGFYTAWIPKIYGGKGWNLGSLIPVVEELCSECAGIGNLMGVQYFGISILFAGWNTRIIDKICRDVVEGEKSGEPCLIAGLVTEPGAGTDAEEMELLAQGAGKMPGAQGGRGVRGQRHQGLHLQRPRLHLAHAPSPTRTLSRPEETMMLLRGQERHQGLRLRQDGEEDGTEGLPRQRDRLRGLLHPRRGRHASTSEQMKELKRSAQGDGTAGDRLRGLPHPPRRGGHGRRRGAGRLPGGPGLRTRDGGWRQAPHQPRVGAVPAGGDVQERGPGAADLHGVQPYHRPLRHGLAAEHQAALLLHEGHAHLAAGPHHAHR